MRIRKKVKSAGSVNLEKVVRNYGCFEQVPRDQNRDTATKVAAVETRERTE